MIRASFSRWIHAPPVRGWQALLCGMVAVWLPTMIRLSVNGAMTGCEFTPYLPFVLISAILLRWWKAAAVALVSVAVLGGLFGGSPAFELECFLPSAGMFLGASAIMIGIAVLIRHSIVAIQARGAPDSSSGLIFSVEQGDVWASWHGQGPPVRLGSQRRVSEVMEEFLTQEGTAK